MSDAIRFMAVHFVITIILTVIIGRNLNSKDKTMVILMVTGFVVTLTMILGFSTGWQ